MKQLRKAKHHCMDVILFKVFSAVVGVLGLGSIIFLLFSVDYLGRLYFFLFFEYLAIVRLEITHQSLEKLSI